MPQMHRRFQLKESMKQIMLILLGVALVLSLSFVA